jgi:hypothetical protein
VPGHLVVLILSIAAGVLLSACGGGSDNDRANSLAPAVVLDAPLDGSVTNQPEQTFIGRLSGQATLTINGVAANVDQNGQFSFGPVTLVEGSNAFTLIATDAQGRTTEISVTVILDTLAPEMANPGLVTLTTSMGMTIAVEGLAGSVEAGASVEITNTPSGESAAVAADAAGAFSVGIAGKAGDLVTIIVRDRAGNASDPLTLEAPVPAASRFGVIGDSMATALHANDMCGSGDELLNCLRKRLGFHDPVWSYAAGDRSWSVDRLAGFTPATVVSAAADGAEWNDALGQAQAIVQSETGAEPVWRVFIGLGANDVCAESGHFYGGDLERIAQHIDATLTYLTDAMAGRPGARIDMAGILDIVKFRDAMHDRRHNYLFNSCQALWDLDVDAIQTEARDSLCKGELGQLCDALPADLESELLDMFIDSEFDQNNVDEGPCGRVLNGANTAEQRAEAREFNIALNALLGRKAAEYDQRNGVSVRFTDALFAMPIEPYMVSQLDCFHPSRAGQLAIAQTIWQGLDAGYTRTDSYYFDDFENPDKCVQEFTSWAGSCWVDGGTLDGFDSFIASDGWYRLLKDTDNNVSHWVERTLGDVSGKSAAWLSFRHVRTGLDDSGDRVALFVFDADGSDSSPPGWVQLDSFAGPGVDVGLHNGEYYDLTPFLSADMKIRFQTNNARSMENGDGLKWDNVSVFAW